MSDIKTGLSDIDTKIAELELERNLILQKAVESRNPHEMIAAMDYKSRNSPPPNTQKAYIFNPDEYSNGLGFKEKNNKLSYEFLRTMSYTAAVYPVISTRVTQMTAFSKPQSDDYATGFVVKPDNPKKMVQGKTEYTDDEKAKIDYITDFIVNCGEFEDRYLAQDFDAYIRKTMWDSLSLDQDTTEVIWNNFGYKSSRGKPTRFIGVDAALFRYADNGDVYDVKHDLPTYVMLYQGIPFVDFYRPELAFGIRNPSTDIRRNGYGRSELEDMLNEVSSFIWATEYNRNYFKNGSMPKGMMRVKGGLSQSKLDEFRRQWYAILKGVDKSHTIPFVEADSLEWQDIMKSNKDMEFNHWIEFLIKLICAYYKLDPSEIGFPMQGSSDAKPMFEGNNESRLKYSKDKGLVPLLTYKQNVINKYIVKAIDPDYSLHFVGLDSSDRSEELEMDIKKLSNFMTVNEIRALKSLPPLKQGGDVILNAQYLQAIGQAMQGGDESNEMMADMYGDEEGEKSKKKNTEEEDPFDKAMEMEIAKALM